MKKRQCSICNQLEIVPADLTAYRQLSHWHYRDERIGPYAAIYAVRPKSKLRHRFGRGPAGVIVYSMPTPGLELRSVATEGLFSGLNRSDMLAMINKNVRCISRVIIEPRFRSLGLAQRLVAETMKKVNVPIVESLAVMGKVNPFFEKAGMTEFEGKEPLRIARIREAFDLVGIGEELFIDSDTVHKRLSKMPSPLAEFIEEQIRLFLASYGRRRDMDAGKERTKFVLSKLCDRPVYFFWRNPALGIRV